MRLRPTTTLRSSKEISSGLQTITGSSKFESTIDGGVVAQLGERSVRNAEVEGSIPFNSTNRFMYYSSSKAGMQAEK